MSILEEALYEVTLESSTPMIMNSSESADPFNPATAEIAEFRKNKNLSTLEQQKLDLLQFKNCLYWSDKNPKGLYLPSKNIKKMLLESARKKEGKKAKSFFAGVCIYDPIGFPLITENHEDLEKFLMMPYKIRGMMKIGMAKVFKTRAKIPNWTCKIKVQVDPTIIDVEMVESWFVLGGKRVGFGDERPNAPTPGAYGKYLVTNFKKISE